MTTKCKPIPGWQTMHQAASQTGYTRQRIHQFSKINPKLHKKVYGRSLVRDPFPISKAKRGR